eukprot:5156537-Amphidinium_carterae.1
MEAQSGGGLDGTVDICEDRKRGHACLEDRDQEIRTLKAKVQRFKHAKDEALRCSVERMTLQSRDVAELKENMQGMDAEMKRLADGMALKDDELKSLQAHLRECTNKREEAIAKVKQDKDREIRMLKVQ